jgi:hypothetical protein
MFYIIKKGASNFWHRYNNNSKEVNLSDFEVVFDSVSQTFGITMLNGANIPQTALSITKIRVIDQTQGNIEEVFANVQELRTRLIQLGYNPLVISGGGGGGVDEFIQLTDTPNTYVGKGGKVVKVKSDESGLEFDDAPSAFSQDIIDALENADNPNNSNPFATIADLSALGILDELPSAYFTMQSPFTVTATDGNFAIVNGVSTTITLPSATKIYAITSFQANANNNTIGQFKIRIKNSGGTYVHDSTIRDSDFTSSSNQFWSNLTRTDTLPQGTYTLEVWATRTGTSGVNINVTKLDLFGLALVGVRGADGGTPVLTEDVTYGQLTNKITNNSLVVGQNYRITDFRTVHRVLGTTEINTGDIEPLTVLAIKSNEISNIAKSELYPNDTINYSVTDNTLMSPSTGSMGVILFRHDLENDLSSFYDFRNVVYRRWAMQSGNSYYAYAKHLNINSFINKKTFGENCTSISVGSNSYNVVIEQDCYSIKIGNYVGTETSGVTMLADCHGIIIEEECCQVTNTGTGIVGGIFISSSSRYIRIGSRSYNIAIGSDCYAIDLGVQNSDVYIPDGTLRRRLEKGFSNFECSVSLNGSKSISLYNIRQNVIPNVMYGSSQYCGIVNVTSNTSEQDLENLSALITSVSFQSLELRPSSGLKINLIDKSTATHSEKNINLAGNNLSIEGTKGQYVRLHKNMLNTTGLQTSDFYLSYTNVRGADGTQNLQQVTNEGNVTDNGIVALDYSVNNGEEERLIANSDGFVQSWGSLGVRKAGNNFIRATIIANELTESRDYILPDKDGTVALLDDIPSQSTPNLQQVTNEGNETNNEIVFIDLGDGYKFKISGLGLELLNSSNVSVGSYKIQGDIFPIFSTKNPSSSESTTIEPNIINMIGTGGKLAQIGASDDLIDITNVRVGNRTRSGSSNGVKEFISSSTIVSMNGTPSASDDELKGYVVGSLWWDKINSKFYKCTSISVGSATWTEIPLGSATWGGITGTLSNQTDLQNNLNARDTANRDRANHTGTQLAATISDFFTQVRATLLTGISFVTATAVTATDTILQAIGKLQAQVDNKENSTNKTSTIAGNESSTTLFSTIKGIVDWVKNGLIGQLPAKASANVDTDVYIVGDSADGFKTKTRTWAQLKANLATVFGGSKLLEVLTPTSSITGTTAEVILHTWFVPANTFNSTDWFRILEYNVVSTGVSTGSSTMRIRFNTSNTLPTGNSTIYATLTHVGGSTDRSFKIIRGVEIDNGKIKGVHNVGSNGIDTPGGIYTSNDFNPAVDNWFFFTVQSADISNTFQMNKLIIRR